MSLTYYNPVYDGDVVYSCDMVRLKFHLNKLNAQSWLDHWFRYSSRRSYYYDMYYSSKIGTYKYLFSCEYRYGKMISSFTIGFGLIESCYTDGANCMIEFNPNKNDMSLICDLFSQIATYITPVSGVYYHLMRWDLAVDVPVKRSNVILLKEGKREYHRIIANSLTEYLGRRNSNGYCKVYDKQVESKLDDCLTRIEVTCDSFECLSLPRVVVLQDVDDDFSRLNSTDIVLVNLIRRLDPAEQQYQLKCLGRNKREKLQEYIYPMQHDFNFDIGKIHFVISGILEFMTNFKGMEVLFDEAVK